MEEVAREVGMDIRTGALAVEKVVEMAVVIGMTVWDSIPEEEVAEEIPWEQSYL